MFERLRSNGLHRGALGGNRIWLVLGLVAWGVRAAQWATHREERVIFREVLGPGERVVVTNEIPTAAKGRRARRSGSA